MSTIEDLNITSILDMSRDDAIEHLRQIRLARRMPVKVQSSTVKKAQANKATPTITKEQAANLLKLLED